MDRPPKPSPSFHEDHDHTILNLGEAPAVMRVSHEMYHETIGTLNARRHLYRIPRGQRQEVSSSRFRSMLMFSILRGVPVDNITVVRTYDEDGRETLEVINGHQRLKGFLHIIDNEVWTPTQKVLNAALPNCKMPLIEPGRSFKHLTPRSQSAIENYKFGVTVLDHFPKEWFPELLTLVNSYNKFTPGQRLRTRPSRVSDLAEMLCDRQRYDLWWRTFSNALDTSNDLDGARFTSAVSMLALETKDYPFTLDLRERQLMDWASGLYDTLMTEELISRVEARMPGVARVFAGANSRARSVMTLMWQASRLLEDTHGFDFTLSEEGCLTPWLEEMKRERKWKGVEHKPYSILKAFANATEQKLFWESQLPYLLLSIPGLVKKPVGEAEEAFYATGGVR